MALHQPSTMSASRSSGGSLIEQIVAERAVHPVFQPIVDLVTQDVVGVEALARGPAGSPLEFPDALFAAAIGAGLLTDLDQLCFARALEVARDSGPLTPSLVFVNAEPAGLSRPLSPELTAVIYGGLPFRIVLELTERALVGSPAALLRVADLVHGAGNAVALDDVGADPASLALLPLVEPDVVKLDMHLIRDPYSAHTQATAAAVCGYADRSGATVLAEGIETLHDADNALALGARWGQGWLFGRPGPLEAIRDRRRGVTSLLGTVPASPRGQDDTPFTIASRQHRARIADPRMAGALIDHVVATALHRGKGGVLVGAVNAPGRPSRWLPGLVDARQDFTYVGLLGDTALPEVDGVQTQQIDDQDPLRAETAVAVLTEDFAMAMCMKTLRPDVAGHGETVEFVHSQNRRVVHAIVRDVMRRFRTW